MQAVVEALQLVHVPVHLAPVAKRSDRARQLGVVRHDRTALAVGAQVLSRVEAEAAEVAERADTAALVLRAVRLARVLDHLQAVPGGDLQERSEEHTSELQSLTNLVCRLLLAKKKVTNTLCVRRIAIS